MFQYVACCSFGFKIPGLGFLRFRGLGFIGLLGFIGFIGFRGLGV